MPGYTHLQRAQPVTLGHHLLAWVEMLDRDRDRFALAAAHAAAVAARRGRAGRDDASSARRRRCATRSTRSPTATSRSTTSTRAPALFVHLSRIGEELALWATAEFGFVALPDSAATGSSMMPQKLNPDVAELARGKAGTAIGRLTGLLATVKGLPLSYNSDLGEDKPAAFAARRDVRQVLAALRRAGARPSRSTRSGWRRRPPTRACSRPTPPRRSSPRASRSATRTSRSRARCARARSTRTRPRPRASPRGSATCGPRSPRPARASPGRSAVLQPRRPQAIASARPKRPDQSALPTTAPSQPRSRSAREVVERARSRRRRAPAARPRARPRAAPMSGPGERAVAPRARDEQAAGLRPPRSACASSRGADVGLGHPAVRDDASVAGVDRDDELARRSSVRPSASTSSSAAVPTIARVRRRRRARPRSPRRRGGRRRPGRARRLPRPARRGPASGSPENAPSRSTTWSHGRALGGEPRRGLVPGRRPRS